jgi:hypothetical protein
MAVGVTAAGTSKSREKSTRHDRLRRAIINLMLRKFLSRRRIVPIVLCLQVVPLLLFPPASYTLASQEWWLPALLTALIAVALVQIIFRRSPAASPWYILSFAQGINIISRLMMLMPHANLYVGGVQRFNASYVVLSVLAMLFSAFEIWYCDLPEVRIRLLA